MKYYIVAGEASGDLHASHLMAELKKADHEARFKCFGGDRMADEGGEIRQHYSTLAYMGFGPVLAHLPQILRARRLCKEDIAGWHPDAVVLVDYPGFNLHIAKHARSLGVPVAYYISPKVWAWKEHRVGSMKANVDKLLSILPFEKGFFRERHGWDVEYVGNPTAHEVAAFRDTYDKTKDDFLRSQGIPGGKPVIALLAGSRKQEISANLPAMISAAEKFPGHMAVIAGAPSITPAEYSLHTAGKDVYTVYGQTYQLLSHADAALVTSGTATLETALFGVPQVVCYKTPAPKLAGWAFRHILKVGHISLANLIAGREVVPELFADRFSVDAIARELGRILPADGKARRDMLAGYEGIRAEIGGLCAPELAARAVVEIASGKQKTGGAAPHTLQKVQKG